jgi:hypothetical protein
VLFRRIEGSHFFWGRNRHGIFIQPTTLIHALLYLRAMKA